MSILKIDDKKLLQKINNIVERAPGNLLNAMHSGMRLFESNIIAKQMSGRKSARYGLNRQTGNLARSWMISVRDPGMDKAVKLGTRTIYARIHQYGGTIRPRRAEWLMFKVNGQFVKTKQVDIPKRLHIIESFKKEGMKLITLEMSKAIRKLL